MIYQLGEHRVQFAGVPAYVAHNATVAGRVTLSENCSIWYNVVIRAEGDDVVIGPDSNVQDGSVLHVDPGFPLRIGRGVTIGHKVMLHGCEIGDHSLVGINAVVLNGAKIGRGCLIGANTLVPENMEVPDGSMVIGTPGKIKRQLSDEQRAGLAMSAEHYVQNGRYHASALAVDQQAMDQLQKGSADS